MRLLSSLRISATGMAAERLRMDVIAGNIANINTTRARYVNGRWLPYQRRQVVFAPEARRSFSEIFTRTMAEQSVSGVRVERITYDKTPFKKVYNPEHPDADSAGYVLMPNVDPLTELVDLSVAERAYEANLAAFNTAKNMYLKALELGK